MNINETKEINEATARAEADLLITEAIESGDNFFHFLRGWMQGEHYAEMAKAAEDWIETMNWKSEEEN